MSPQISNQISNQIRQLKATLNFGVWAFVTIISMAASAQNLPSQQYDDYDLEKYQQILNQTQSAYDQSAEQLRWAESAFAEADHREDMLRRQHEQSIREFQNQRQHESEVVNAIRQSQAYQQNLMRTIDINAKDLVALKNQLADAGSSLDRLNQISAGLKSDLDSASSELTSANANLTAKQNAFDKADVALTQENNLIENLKKSLDSAPPDKKSAIQEQINAELQKLPDLMSARSSSAKDLSVAKDIANLKQAAYNTAKSRYDAAATESNRAQARLNQVQTAIQAKQTELANNQRALSLSQRQEQELTANLAETRRRLGELGRQISDLEGRIRRADAETNQRRYERDQSRDICDMRLRDRNLAQSRLNEVANNIETARNIMQSFAGQQGAADGDREGREIGTARGTSEGQSAGLNEGNLAGVSDGKDRDYNDGKQNGLNQAEQEASNPRSINTPEHGPAYEEGKIKGKDFGYKTGSNKAAYNKGRSHGEVDGLANARQDAQPMEQIGYSDREQTYLNAPLKKVTLGEATIMKNFKGVQSRDSGSGDGRYYNPRPGNYPHPRIKQFYMQYYDDAYRSTLEQSYSSAKAVAYKAAYDQSYQQAYAQALAADYPDSRNLGFNQAYLGFTQGNAQGSELKGYDEGQKFAYDNNIEIEKKKSYNHGVTRCDNLYVNNAVIKVVSIDLIDNDRDGINRPGETLQSIYVVRNFGLVAKSNLGMEATVVSGSASVIEARANSPAIPPQSEATVIGREQVQISMQANEGDSLQLNYRLIDDNELARQSFARTVFYPTVTNTTDFDGVIVPGTNTALKISITNRSKLPQNLNVQLAVDTSKINLAQPQINVDRLNPGESKTLTFNISGNPSALFQDSTITTTVIQNGLVFGKLSTNVTITNRHTSTPDSIGLIISGNLTRGGGKALFGMSKFDTWDLRIDGAIALANLNDYANKIVHVMADAGSSLDASSLQALVAFVNSGGQLVLWGSDLDQSGIFAQLQTLSQVQPSHANGINTILSGQSILGGLNVPVNGQVATLNATGIKVRSILASQVGTHGFAAFTNGLLRDQRTGRIYIFAMNPSDVSAAFVNGASQMINNMALTFSQKLANAANNSQWVSLLLLDIQDEVLMAQAESQKWYSDHRTDNKIYKSLEVLMNANDASRDAFARGYKLIAMMLPSLSSQVKNSVYYEINSASAGSWWKSKTWNRLFCNLKENHGTIYCP